MAIACRSLLLIPVLLTLTANLAPAQPTGSVERIQVRGRHLEGNLSGDSPVRDVGVYLPPSYTTDTSKRYPVIYMLHGFTGKMEEWFEKGRSWVYLPGVMDRGMARDDVQEAIVVTPDAFTRFAGSMYSSGPTTGNWERFVAEELVAYIDSHYRTLPRRESRGLAGHSMGGYGTLRIGMKRPDVFAAFYVSSPCCLTPPKNDRPGFVKLLEAVEKIRSDEQFADASFMVKAILASAAAWAPNPKNPPFYLDLPTKDGEIQPDIVAKFTANAPMAFIDQYIGNLRQYKGLAFDSGDNDGRITESVKTLDDILNSYGIPHEFEIYQGDHTSGAARQMEQRMLPFFTTRLVFE